MSDDERSGSEYEEEEEEQRPAKKEPETPKKKTFDSLPAKEMSEGELELMKAKKKVKEEEEARYKEYLEIRKAEREKEEAALEELRERQIQRRREYDEELAKLEETRRVNEEAREREEEEMDRRKQEEQSRREAERRRRQNELSNILGKTGPQSDMQASEKDRDMALRNLEGMEGMGFGGGATRRRGPKHWVEMSRKKTQEELDAEKEEYLSKRRPKVDTIDRMSQEALKKMADGLQARIVKIENDKYDMDQRMQRQDYDLKELGERSKQQQKQFALKKGIDPEGYITRKHPLKKPVSNPYDRKVDSRSFVERRDYFIKEEDAKSPKKSAAKTAEPKSEEPAEEAPVEEAAPEEVAVEEEEE